MAMCEDEVSCIMYCVIVAQKVWGEESIGLGVALLEQVEAAGCSCHGSGVCLRAQARAFQQIAWPHLHYHMCRLRISDIILAIITTCARLPQTSYIW